MWVAAFALAANFMGSSILTPLYPIYQQRFGSPELMVTLIYAVYVIGNLAVLCFFGRLSDQIGRRPAALAAPGTGALAQYAPWPLHLSHVVFLVLLSALVMLLWNAPETVAHPQRCIRKLDLRPRIGVPPGIRVAFVAPAALSFTGFALAGFYAALGLGLLMQSLHQHNLFIVGGTVSMFFAVSAVTAIVTRRLSTCPAMVVTLVLLLIGLGLLTLAEATHSLSLLLIGTVASGAVLALAYRASPQIINEISPEGQRAEVLASFQIVHFVANSLPVIGVGLLALVISTPAAHRVFAIVLVVLASLACVVGLRYMRRDSMSGFTSR